MKNWVYKNATVSMEKTFPSGYYIIILRIGNEIKDKIKLDDYRSALAYVKSFRKIAKNA